MRGMTDFEARLRSLHLRRAGLALGLWGEPGVGKTFTARAWLRGSACRTVTVHARAPLADLVRAVPGSPRLPAWAEPTLERLARGEYVETAHAAEAALARLRAAAPLILHVEDLHEVSPERLDFFSALARGTRRSRGVGLLVTSRTRPPEAFEAERCEPLDAERTRLLIEGEVGGRLPGEAAEWVFRRAAGNPLFTLAYVRDLARTGHLWNDTRHWHWREPAREVVPLSVEALIEGALREAAGVPTLAAALGARATLPQGAGRGLWARVAALTPDELEAARLELERRSVFVGENFAHPLYRELCGHVLDPAGQRELARRALVLLPPDDPAETAALIEAAGLEASGARALLGAAARRAQAAGNGVVAARFLARAAGHARGGEAARLALEAARNLREVDVGEATRLARLAAGDPATREEALWLQAELLAAQGQGREGERLLEDLPPEVRRGPAFLARVLGLRAQDNHGLIELLDAHPGLLAHADPGTLWRAARALAYQGRSEEAEAIAVGVLARPGLSPEGRALALKAQSVVRQVRGDFEGMERLEHEVLDLARASGNLRLTDAALFNRAMALGTLGRLRERDACLEEALRVCRALGDPTAHVIAQVAYGTALAESGEYERAETLLLEARAFLEGVDVSGYLVDCECALSELYRSWQPAHSRVLAVRHAGAALDHARRLDDLRSRVQSLSTLSLAEGWAGEAGRAAALAGEALDLLGALDMPELRLIALKARGTALAALGHTDEARAALSEAEAIARRMGNPREAHAAGLHLDRLANDLAGARERLAWFETHGLPGHAAQARRLFPELETGPTPAAAPTLRLDVLGEMCFGDGGGTRPVRGGRRQELLALLLQARLRGQAEVSRPGLLEALYPGVGERQAAVSLKELVHLTRSALGRGLIQTTPGGYALGEVGSDAETFLRTGETRLWRGPYLAGLTLDLADDSVREALHHALRERMAALLGPDPLETARLGRLLLEAEPYDRGALLLTLRALRAGGNHRGLKRLYEDARARWREVGETLPPHWAELIGASA
ncbi:tetratricopeptide TPR_4 [Deinococcus aerius]|uniref:Tetratricopeptide TPR_4 n=2 Tax=Deinococcus aerius TaxID=200253 RepID=A0A2I9D8J5_9DEIO|nr:tetratricopeptide TPR_4 [Deinococcus aerius]